MNDCIAKHLSSPESTPWCWLFYGDSITHGAKHTHGWRDFTEIFAERLRWELSLKQDVVINTGISENSTVDLLRDYEWRVRHWRPNVVFVLIGTNDIVKLDNIGLFQDNLNRLLELLQEEKAIPILQTYPTIQYIQDNAGYVKRYEEMPAYNQAIRDIAQKNGILLIDHDRHWQECASDPDILASWLGEPIHPGALGHLEMAKTIFKELGIYDAKACSCNPVGTPFSIAPVK
ncbi:MAG: SGNH/GDSL hydrolase family protein [Victivallales bacterium]|nr:SGNH/GDSL hydrolase family protein [Victivallales bacterium]